MYEVCPSANSQLTRTTKSTDHQQYFAFLGTPALVNWHIAPMPTTEKASKKPMDSPDKRSEKTYREKLPEELETRLRAVWSRLGHLIEWCDDGNSWLKKFCSEVRPFRETFYWEAVAEIVADYSAEHPDASPESILTDCLIATQCSPSHDDAAQMVRLREAWQDILDSSREEIETFLQADLDLAVQEGTMEEVARLYAFARPTPSSASPSHPPATSVASRRSRMSTRNLDRLRGCVASQPG